MTGMSSRLLVVAVLAAVAGPWSAVLLHACRCGDVPDCRSAASYDAVFEATVEALIPPPARPDGLWSSGDSLTVRLRDLRPIRGEARPQVITAQGTSLSCGYSFSVGRRYLIFATRSPDDGELHVTSCGLTQPVAMATSGLLRYLDSLALPSRGGRLWGRVLEPRGDTSQVEPMRAVTVSLTGERGATTTTTAEGEFEFVDLPPGSYELTVPNSASRPELRFFPRTVTLAGDRACADVFMVLRIDSLIQGQVVDQDGQPIKGVLVSITSARRERRGVTTVTTDEAGWFRLESVAAGRYTARIRLDADRLGLAALEPGRTAIEIPIDLASGGHVTLEPVRLRRFPRVLLAGRVVNDAGAGVRGLYVWITALDDAGARPARTWTLSDGTFSIAAIEGRRYRIEIGDRERPQMRVEVTASDQPVTLSIAAR